VSGGIKIPEIRTISLGTEAFLLLEDHRSEFSFPFYTSEFTYICTGSVYSEIEIENLIYLEVF